MRQALFTITCTTCHVRLAVRSAEAVGAILECPKCGCMVPVMPPEGWQPPKPPETSAAQGLPEGTSQSLPSNGPGAIPPVSTPESGDAVSAVHCDAVMTVSQGDGWRHSWHLIIAAPIAAAAIGIVAWLTLLSGAGSDNSPKPAAEQSTAIDKSETTEGASNPGDKPDTKPAAENSAEAKSGPGPDTSATKATEHKEPDQKTPQADTAEAKTSGADTPQPTASAEEKNHPNEAESAENKENKENKEPAPPDMRVARLVKLVAPETIDVQSRLSEVIPAIEIRDMPFARAIGLLAALSGLPITIDPEAVARLQVSLRDPISIRMSGATMEEVLQEIAARQGMAFTAENGQVLVTDPAEQREKLRHIRYTVSDLTNNDKSAADQLAALVQKLIVPESWQSAGGEGTIETEKTALVVAQTAAVHDQILVFCEKLRNARGRPLKSNRDPKRFDLSTRLQQAASALNRQVTANFHEPAKLVDILAYLGQQAEIDILVDRQALGAAGLSDKSEISFTVENRPLTVALNDLLTPLKLGYRPINSHTLQVTTQSALDSRQELEFYPVGKMLGKDQSGSDLVEQIKTAVSSSSWNGPGPAAIYLDQLSNTLIVLQSPPVHAAIQVFLNKTLDKRK
ncbi:MAG: hypothetical protein ABSE63_01435 [Thermoguttaceae bacterium]